MTYDPNEFPVLIEQHLQFVNMPCCASFGWCMFLYSSMLCICFTPYTIWSKKKETYRWCNYTWLFVKFTCALQRITAHHHKIDGDWSDSNWESQMSVECWYVIKNVNSPSHCNLSLKNSEQKRKRNIKIVSFINVNIKAQTSIHIHLNAPSCKVQIIEMITIMFIRQICHWINSINIH